MRLTFAMPLLALLLLSPLNPRGLAPSPAHAEGPHPTTRTASIRIGTIEDGVPAGEGDRSVEPRSPSGRAPAWVAKRPGPETQLQKSARERGANPCMAPDPGFGAYTPWDRSPRIGQMIVPKDLKLGKDGEFDVFFHFHGHDPARKAWVQAMDSAVLVGIDLGIGSGAYLDKFQAAEEFPGLLASVEESIASRFSVPRAKAGRVGLSAWSAGYGAVAQVLRHTRGTRAIDTVVLLDGLHTAISADQLDGTKLEPFVDFSLRAARGETLMFVSHSSIIPPDYASTTQTASYLIWKVGGVPQPARSRAGDPVGLDLISRFSTGDFHVRGFAGNDTLDHCAHLSLFKDVLRTHVVPRWSR